MRRMGSQRLVSGRWVDSRACSKQTCTKRAKFQQFSTLTGFSNCFFKRSKKVIFSGHQLGVQKPQQKALPPRRSFPVDAHIFAEGCAGTRRIVLSPAFRAPSPQRVARAAGAPHSNMYFAHSTRTISSEGCAGSRRAALSSAFFAHSTCAISSEGRART